MCLTFRWKTVILHSDGPLVGAPHLVHCFIGVVSIAFAYESSKGLSCALFYDADDGEDFGNLVAGQLLADFVAEYPDHRFTGGAHKQGAFDNFASRLPSVLDHATHSLMSQRTRPLPPPFARTGFAHRLFSG